MGTKCLRHSAVAALPGGMALTGCELGTNFSPPHAAIPIAYIQDASANHTIPYTSGNPVDPNWWQSFNDPCLMRLETLAVKQNIDLQIATERLLEAEAQAQITGANLYPNLSGAGSYTREGPSKEGIFTALDGPPSSTAADNAGAIANGNSSAVGGGGVTGSTIAPLDLYQYRLQAMYDVDLWGKNRRAIEAAIAAAASSQEARRASLLNVEVQVASYYIQTRGAESVLTITQHNLEAAQQLVDLTVEREQAGLATTLDVTNARASAAQITSEIPSFITRRDTDIAQISLLLGVNLQSLPANLGAPADVPLTPPAVPIGLPSDLLRRRPDVREAEDNLHQATAETGVAVASFFPEFSFDGSVSFQALQFKNLNEFRAITYAFCPELSLPIFNGGQLTGLLKLRKAQQREAALSYAKIVQQAFYQVDTALIGYNQEHATLAELKVYTQQSQIAFGLAEDDYKQGVADYLSVLTAQQGLLSAQQTEAQAVASLSGDLVTLYQALGGGWEQTFPDDVPVVALASAGSAPGGHSRSVLQ